MLNAYGLKSKKLFYKSQLLFSLGIVSFLKGFFDRPAVKGALSFYIYDELNLVDCVAALPPTPPISDVSNIPAVAMPSKLAGIMTEV
jgi:hypothetical protein